MLPEWPEGTLCVLATQGDEPRTIPVSTAVRVSDTRLRLALAQDRESLARLRDDPQVALCVLAGDLAFTAHGRARVVAERLVAPNVAAVEVEVHEVTDHLDGRTELLEAVRWRWREPEQAERERAVIEELKALAP